MLSALHTWRLLTMESIMLRLVLAVACGGLIGLERTFRRRPAGFRTHILICMGACVTMLVGQFLVTYMHFHTDISRMGAQVIAGVGFIGAGTIIVTRHQRVKGLTTAAGLWTAAVIGLALGAGFYEGGAAATVLVLVAETVFAKVERMILRKSPEINLYVRYENSQTLERILTFLRENRIRVLSMEVTRAKGGEDHKATVILLLQQTRSLQKQNIPGLIEKIEGVATVDTLSG